MTNRDATLPGTPCWADLWTSDVAGSRRFYAALFGWEPLAPDARYGGYFNFAHHGAWVAGCMGDTGEMPATDTWKPYLATPDIAATLDAAGRSGARVGGPPMPVGDLGVQAVLEDPTGAAVGLWQAGTWPGFTVTGVPGAPSWFELHTRDYAGAVAFYRDVFGLEVTTVSDSGEFRYSTLRRPGAGTDLAGICDDSKNLADHETPHWAVYWEVDDIGTATATVRDLGGTVFAGPDATPYGRIAVVADPAGAAFMLRSSDG